MSLSSSRLDRYKLVSELTENSVTHRTFQSDLSTGRRRTEVLTTWVHERKLGAGAFGEVSLQREKVSGQLRAVKVISQRQLRVNEMDALIDLQDRCDLFVTFLGWYEDPRSVHIAMEYIANGDLGQYITDHSVKAKSEAQEISIQILEGLVVLHEREICHRDLKPQNVLMASISPIWVKITDFGISKRWAGTELRTQCGTPVYKAPELVGLLPKRLRTDGQMYSSSVDIWALGAIIHQVLTSQIPFLEYSYDTGNSSYYYTAAEWNLDGELLLDYCADRVTFPVASLVAQGASANAIDFVKSLMVPDPRKRLSAADALGSVWLAEWTSGVSAAGASPSQAADSPVEVMPMDQYLPPQVLLERANRLPTVPPKASQIGSSLIFQMPRRAQLPISVPPPVEVPTSYPSINFLSFLPYYIEDNPCPTTDFKSTSPVLFLIICSDEFDTWSIIESMILALTGDEIFKFSRVSIHVTQIININRHKIRLMVGPERGFSHMVSELLEKVPGRQISGIIFINQGHSPGRVWGGVAKEIHSLAEHCVPHLHSDMMVFARASIQFFTKRNRSVILRWNKAGRIMSENRESEVAQFMALLTQIAESEVRAKQSFRVVQGGPSSADLGWITESYFKECESLLA